MIQSLVGMENACMTIEYSLSRSEIVRGFLQGVRVSPRFRATLVVYSVGTAVFVLAMQGALSRPLGIRDLITGFAWAACALVFMPLWLFLRGKTALRTLTVSSDGISTQIGRLKGNVPWAKVKMVKDASEYVLIASASGNSFIIPSRAFAGPNQRSQFLREIDAWRRVGPEGRA